MKINEKILNSIDVELGRLGNYTLQNPIFLRFNGEGENPSIDSLLDYLSQAVIKWNIEIEDNVIAECSAENKIKFFKENVLISNLLLERVFDEKKFLTTF